MGGVHARDSRDERDSYTDGKSDFGGNTKHGVRGTVGDNVDI